ncbi:MAG: PEP-CTERM sorting domain-containing protein [Steroidobacteraceae bacterium]
MRPFKSVPEPGTIGLLNLGLAGIAAGICGRRKH